MNTPQTIKTDEPSTHIKPELITNFIFFYTLVIEAQRLYRIYLYNKDPISFFKRAKLNRSSKKPFKQDPLEQIEISRMELLEFIAKLKPVKPLSEAELPGLIAKQQELEKQEQIIRQELVKQEFTAKQVVIEIQQPKKEAVIQQEITEEQAVIDTQQTEQALVVEQQEATEESEFKLLYRPNRR